MPSGRSTPVAQYCTALDAHVKPTRTAADRSIGRFGSNVQDISVEAQALECATLMHGGLTTEQMMSMGMET